jgi:hypothetical protein
MSKLEQDPPEPEQSPEATQSAENAEPPPKSHTSTTESMSSRTSRKEEEPSIFGRDLLAFIAVFVCIFAVLTYRQFGPRKMLLTEDIELPVIGIGV